jgi:DNA-binding IclR family transcriptional regulator
MASSVPAAEQTLAILRYLARHSGPVPAATIARDLGIARSSTYHLLRVLAREGFVVHLPEERRYGVGVSALELGSAFARQAPLQRLARAPLARLVDQTGHSAHLAILHGRDVLYVVEERAPGRPSLVTDVGVRLPAQLTASGRSMLAALQPSQVRALFPDRSAFVERHGSGPASLSGLRRLLTEVRQRGYAVEDGEVTPGFASVASAAYDHNGHPVAGVAITFPAAEVSATERVALAAAVRATAAALTRRVSGRPPAT